MQYTLNSLLLALATTAFAAPVDNDKRQLESGSVASASASGLSIPSLSGVALPTGLSSSGGLGESGSSSPSGLGSSLGGLESPSSGLAGLGDSSSDLTPTATLQERQSWESWTTILGSLESGSTGIESSTGSSSLESLTGSSTVSTSSSSSTSTSTATASSDGSCKALTFIFARGTSETGTLGTVIGAPLATALANKLGSDKVTISGVDYPADAAGNANEGASGGPAMATLAKDALSSCPDSKIVLSGYSQGAMVVHNALSDQGVDGSKIAAVVAFGDPFNGDGFEGVDASKVMEYCGSADPLCSSGGTNGSGSHLDYGDDADAAATWIISTTGL